jgi:HSP20 family protein
MTVIRYPQAWSSQTRLHQDLNHLFGAFFQGDRACQSQLALDNSQWVPRVDIKEEPDRFVIFADVPGVDPQEVEVLMDRGVLTIKGERKSETGDNSENFSRIERRYGGFNRRFVLPDTADADSISAHGRNGVLEISIPKKPQPTPRRIEIGA